MTLNSNQQRAQALHEEAQALEDAGEADQAIEKYLQAIELEPTRSASHYNLGLIYKYRKDWENSLLFNRIANELDPDDEAARWNLAIAATALRDWSTARRAWRDNGLTLDGGEGGIEMDFGLTPVRLNPDGDAEVLWARRIDPVRARLLNIPFAGSGYHLEDIVLHDGAPAGYRMLDGRECPVFDVLELFEASGSETFEVDIEVHDVADMETLAKAFDDAGLSMEDWTGNVRMLCKQCSEGVPHEHHDQEAPADWSNKRSLGIAASDWEAVQAVLERWKAA